MKKATNPKQKGRIFLGESLAFLFGSEETIEMYFSVIIHHRPKNFKSN